MNSDTGPCSPWEGRKVVNCEPCSSLTDSSRQSSVYKVVNDIFAHWLMCCLHKCRRFCFPRTRPWKRGPIFVQTAHAYFPLALITKCNEISIHPSANHKIQEPMTSLTEKVWHHVLWCDLKIGQEQPCLCKLCDSRPDIEFNFENAYHQLQLNWNSRHRIASWSD